MSKFSILALIAVMILAVALVGCGGGGGGGGGNGSGGIDDPPPPIDDGNLGGDSGSSGSRLIGKVVRSTDGAAVANVAINFGINPTTGQAITAKSGSTGTFAIDIPLNTTVLGLFPGDSITFSVNTSGLSNYPTDANVSYDENNDGIYSSYPQGTIPVSIGVLQGATTNLGSIIVNYSGSSGGGGDVDPPDFPF